MKPSFALSLSSTGITLLHRAAGGWRNIGTVDFDSADMDADLAELRAKGLDYGAPLQCKLILPNDQIRYLTLETGDISDETRLAEARLALADATPYDLYELAFDISADGTRTHVAAVAYETLVEAESFAQMHGFGPVCFVAQPEAADYLGEPFFGPAAAMEGTEVTPDGVVVVDIGPALPPVPQDAEPPAQGDDQPDTSSEVLSDAAAPEDTAHTSAEEPPHTDLAPPLEAEPEAAPAPETQVDILPAALGTDPDTSLEEELTPSAQMSEAERKALDAQSSVPTPPTDTVTDTRAPAAPSKPSADVTTIETITARLSSRAAQALARDDLPDNVSPQTPTGLPEALDFGALATLTPQQDTRTPSQFQAETRAAPPSKEDMHPAPVASPQPPVVGFSSRRSANPDLSAEPRRDSGRPASRIPTLSAVRSIDPPAKPAATPIASPIPGPVTAPPAPAAMPSAPPPPSPAAVPIAARAAHSETLQPPVPDKAFLGQIKPKQIAVPANSAAAQEAQAARAAYDADKGEKTGALVRAISRKPRFMGLMLTSLLLLFMAVVAAIAFWSDSDEAFDELSPPAPALAPQLLPDDTTPNADTNAAQPDAPDASGLPPGDASPAETPAASAPPAAASEPEVAQVQDETPPAESAALTETDTAVLDALQSEEIAARPEALEPAEGAISPSDKSTVVFDAQQSEVDNDPELDADALEFLDPLVPPSVDERSLRTTYAATGAWQKVPDILTPDATASLADLDNIYSASIDKSDLSHDTIPLPDPSHFGTDSIQTALSTPLVDNSEFDLDDRGLVTATPEGTVNPDGITIYLGRPTKVPPKRPVPPAVTAPETRAVPLKRPRQRPIALQRQAEERARRAEQRLEQLAQKRPRARPEGLVAPAPPEPEIQAVEADAVEAAIAAAQDTPTPTSDLAIVSSVVPRPRPRGFEQLIDRAEAAPASNSAPTVQASAVTTPRIPSSASVTRQATVSKAIDLRKLNLIGISGSASDRRALVRLPSGRITRVKVGDSIDGGSVTAIDNERLLYQKRGRNHTLQLPKG